MRSSSSMTVPPGSVLPRTTSVATLRSNWPMARSSPRTPASRVYPRMMKRQISGENETDCSGETVLLKLAPQRVAAGDLDFLVFRVPGDFDHLHPVAQPGNMLGRVRGRDEQDLREIVGRVEVVIGEGRILLRVEHLQHCRGRVAPVVGGELVDLVKQDHRVDRSGGLHRRDDPARHRADVGTPVTADFGLVPNAAEGDTDKFPAHRFRDRAPKAGLADAGRPHQAEDLGRGGGAGVSRQHAHGDKLEKLHDRLSP